jgi:hypothetical protein
MLTSNEARTSRFGPSYFGQAGFVSSGTPLEGTAVRPTLAAVGLVDQLRRAAPPSWEIGLSDKGAYALGSARIFGGVAGLAAALRDPATRAVLDAFARPEYEDGPGSYLRDPRRWVLTFDEIRTLVGDDAAETVLKDLDEREAIRRGHALKCSYCRATSFYTLDEHQRFTCVRCRHEQRATKRSWWGEPEPPFRYALAEVVHQFLAHNGHVPLLATYEHFDSATGRDRRSLDVAFEVEVKSPDREAPSEHDIAASWGADLWLGEATQKPEFASSRRKEEARLRRLVEVARTLHARGIILVTTSESFAGRTGESVARILEDPWIKLEVVEGLDAGAVTATADAL